MSGPRDRNSIDEQRLDGERSEGSRPDEHLAGDEGDESFEVYLQRGSVVSESYRALEHEQPPGQLDASVLGQAQAALQERSTRKYRQWKKWTVPVALAASTVIAVSIVLESGMQHEVRSAASVGMLEGESRAVGSERVAQPTEAAPATSSSAANNVSSDQTISSESASTQAPSPQSSPAQNPSEPRDSAQEQFFALDAPSVSPPQATVNSEADGLASTANAEKEEQKAGIAHDSALARTQRAKRDEPAARSAAAPASRSVNSEIAAERDLSVSAKQSAAPTPLSSPEAWLELIRDLRKAGKIADADREWRAFNAAYPDFDVAPDDVARPAGTADH
jgi:hypothetical protein